MVEEREIYKLISETMHEGLLELDLHGKIVQTNPAALVMLGFTREEIIQKTHRDLTPAKWHQQESRTIQETTLAQGKTTIIEQEYLRKDGSLFPVALKPILLADADKKPTKIIILFQDLTGQKEQEQLQRSHLRRLNSLSLITKKLQENDTIEHTIHFVLEALVAAMTHPHLAVPLIAIEEETFSTNKYSDDLEYGLSTTLFVNGREAGEVTVYYSENKPFVLPDEQNILDTAAGALGIWLSLKAANQELADFEEQYRSIFDNMEDGFALYEVKDEGRELIVADWNRAAEKMYNLLRPDVLGQDIKKFFPAMEETAFYKTIVECSGSGESKIIPLVHYQDTQRDQFLHTIIYRVGDKIAVIFRDVTGEEKVRQELMYSEQKFRSLIEGSAEAVYIYTLDPVNPQFVAVNRSACQMMHYTREELLALGPARINSLEYAALVPARIAKVLSEGTALFESEYVTKEGQHIPVEVNTSVVEVGGQKHILSFVRDITERKKAKDTLYKQQQELSAIVDSSPAMIFYKDRENNLIRVNQAMAKGAALTKEQMEGKSLFDLYPREMAEHYWQDDKEVMDSGQPKLNIVESMETKEGLKWVQTDKIPYKNEKGEIIGIIGFAVDITERKAAEEKIAKGAQEWADTFDAMTDGVSIHSPDFTILNINKVFCQLLGKSREEIIGRKCYEILHGLNSPVTGCPLEKSKSSLKEEYAELFKPIYNRWISATVSPIFDETGKLVMFVHLIRDITERKRAEELIKQSEVQYRTLVNNLPGAVYRCVNDADWTLYFISEAIESLSGYPASDFIDNKVRSYNSIIYPDDRDQVYDIIKQHIEKKDSYSIEYRLLHRDGTLHWVTEKGQGIYDNQGVLLWLDGVIFDITERQRMEEELQKRLNELERFNKITIEREKRIIELKKKLKEIQERADEQK